MRACVHSIFILAILSLFSCPHTLEGHNTFFHQKPFYFRSQSKVPHAANSITGKGRLPGSQNSRRKTEFSYTNREVTPENLSLKGE